MQEPKNLRNWIKINDKIDSNQYQYEWRWQLYQYEWRWQLQPIWRYDRIIGLGFYYHNSFCMLDIFCQPDFWFYPERLKDDIPNYYGSRSDGKNNCIVIRFPYNYSRAMMLNNKELCLSEIKPEILYFYLENDEPYVSYQRLEGRYGTQIEKKLIENNHWIKIRKIFGNLNLIQDKELMVELISIIGIPKLNDFVMNLVESIEKHTHKLSFELINDIRKGCGLSPQVPSLVNLCMSSIHKSPGFFKYNNFNCLPLDLQENLGFIPPSNSDFIFYQGNDEINLTLMPFKWFQFQIKYFSNMLFPETSFYNSYYHLKDLGENKELILNIRFIGNNIAPITEILDKYDFLYEVRDDKIRDPTCKDFKEINAKKLSLKISDFKEVDFKQFSLKVSDFYLERLIVVLKEELDCQKLLNLTY